MAQFPPHGQRLGQRGRVATRRLEDVKTLLRHENIATTSDIYGNFGIEAKRGIQQRLVNFVKEQLPSTTQ
jgi:hypothetical protein